ncbi:30S ribosomal protein S6 [Anabaenopsis tanganyikae CS-531]|jgi:small subunit ribosomal protein S6|uniref:Small ribosomal subunit protein bS6 n=2 Tax=Anabaenopsis TaxID=110103 RepID=A0ABT6KA88_9CYAN|nr:MULTISPECIES: 30S ribosomal protein S6 [Anabaenopsis]MDB9540923.1 30S ribosomal protein S6 [Anabaenopsis arnoldii]MDH6093360.1 30S ribosomal protein S6 [Anabaenopsis arnoldii]MDH6104718.1 30S ribosomal protein S6 [Anabaenopsis tanganyikae CS-531]
MSIVYETIYILRPDLGDEQVEQAIAKYQNLLTEQGAENIEIQNRGKRRLAYEIKKHRDGIYVQMNYTGPGNAIAVMERAMRLSEEVIRYLTIKQELPKETAQAEAEAEQTEAVAV